MTRPFFSSIALALALLAVLAVESLSSGAAHASAIPAVSTPSVTVPSMDACALHTRLTRFVVAPGKVALLTSVKERAEVVIGSAWATANL